MPWKTPLTKHRIQQIFEIFARANPHPQTELQYRTPFELLVAVVLSAQSTDAQVNKVTKPLFECAPTPETIWALGPEGLSDHLRTLGLFRNKTKHILALCEQLIAHHHSQVPNTREALEALPGVGRKTANVILNTLYGEPLIAVDTHIFRTSQRIGLARGNTVREIEEQLMQTIPQIYHQHAHHWLILHGRYCCQAQKPQCETCPIQKHCLYYQDGY